MVRTALNCVVKRDASIDVIDIESTLEKMGKSIVYTTCRILKGDSVVATGTVNVSCVFLRCSFTHTLRSTPNSSSNVQVYDDKVQCVDACARARRACHCDSHLSSTYGYETLRHTQ
jgi:hypothetical protein